MYVPWRETSLLVEVLTQAYGRLGLIARGVQGLKKQTLRAALQPLQWIRFSAIQRGELGQLRQAEALDTAPRLKGETMLASFYINELLLRLVPRHAPVNELYLAYSQTRERLRTNDSLAWSLRLFELDILETLGVGFNLECDANGTPLDPAARYVLDPLEGPRLLLSEHNNAERRDTATGHVLLALAHKQIPNTSRFGWPTPQHACSPVTPPGRPRPEVVGNRSLHSDTRTHHRKFPITATLRGCSPHNHSAAAMHSHNHPAGHACMTRY